jgi:small GTP-binding protein
MKDDLKVLLLGNSGAGKTCGLLRYVNNSYSDTFITTIGIDFKIKFLDVNNQPIRLQVWDTAGQERFRSITENCIKNNADVIILCYDITDRQSFVNLENWIKTIILYRGEIGKTILVGTKLDQKEFREVSQEKAILYCEKHGIKYYEMSGKTNENVEYVFHNAVRLALNLSIDSIIANTKPKNKPSACVPCTII